MLSRELHGPFTVRADFHIESPPHLHVCSVSIAYALCLFQIVGAEGDSGEIGEQLCSVVICLIAPNIPGQSDNLHPNQPHDIPAILGDHANADAGRYHHAKLRCFGFHRLLLHYGILCVAQLRHRECVEDCCVSNAINFIHDSG